MKPGIICATLVAVIITILVVEESRIRVLQRDLDHALLTQTPSKSDDRVIANRSHENRTTSPNTKSPREEGANGETNQESRMSEIGKAMRKMADNPAAKAMFAQAHKGTALNIYGPLLEQFDFNDEEEEYFINLLAGEFAQQQQLGMKLMGAQTEAEREEIIATFASSEGDLKEAVKEFLNNEEDNEKYESYQKRLAEHQQMPGIKAAMDGIGFPLRPDQEAPLIEAMFEARNTATPSEEWEGAAGLKKMQEGDAVEQFEQAWVRNQEVVKGKVKGVLDAEQLEAFTTVQEQMKEFQLMGIKMMQGMTNKQE